MLICCHNSTFHKNRLFEHEQILSLSSSSSSNYDILVLACLPLNQTFAAQETWEKNFVFQLLELWRSWIVGLKTLTLYWVPAEVIKLNNRKHLRRSSVFPARGQSYESFKHELKRFFYQYSMLIKGGWNAREKTMEQAVTPGNFKRRCKRSPYDCVCCSTKSLFSSIGDVVTRSRLPSPLILAHFPQPKLSVTLNRI